MLETGGVAGVVGGGAVADGFPEEGTAVRAAAGAEEVVVEEVAVGCCGVVEPGDGCAYEKQSSPSAYDILLLWNRRDDGGTFQCNDEAFVFPINKDMTSQSIFLPTEIQGVVVSRANILPLPACAVDAFIVSVRGHAGEAQHSVLIRNIGSSDDVYRPGGR